MFKWFQEMMQNLHVKLCKILIMFQLLLAYKMDFFYNLYYLVLCNVKKTPVL